MQLSFGRCYGAQVRTLLAVAIMCSLLAACGGSNEPEGQATSSAPGAEPSGSPLAQSAGVRIAAASDLQFAIPELAKEFAKQQPNVAITPTFGSSGNFDTQIRNGAPFDLYFSADVSFPQKLEAEGFAEKGTVFEYAVGRIVVAVKKDSPLDVKALGIKALTDPSVRKLAIANPKHAPYGRAAEAAMRQLGVYDQVKDKLVLGENISQTAQFLESGAADVAIIALSLTLAPTATFKYSEIPADSHPEILQGGAIVAKAQDKQAAQLFVDFVQGEKGRAIMSRFGFVAPNS